MKDGARLGQEVERIQNREEATDQPGSQTTAVRRVDHSGQQEREGIGHRDIVTRQDIEEDGGCQSEERAADARANAGPVGCRRSPRYSSRDNSKPAEPRHCPAFSHECSGDHPSRRPLGYGSRRWVTNSNGKCYRVCDTPHNAVTRCQPAHGLEVRPKASAMQRN